MKGFSSLNGKWFSGVFRCYKMEILGRNGSCRYLPIFNALHRHKLYNPCVISKIIISVISKISVGTLARYGLKEKVGERPIFSFHLFNLLVRLVRSSIEILWNDPSKGFSLSPFGAGGGSNHATCFLFTTFFRLYSFVIFNKIYLHNVFIKTISLTWLGACSHDNHFVKTRPVKKKYL